MMIRMITLALLLLVAACGEKEGGANNNESDALRAVQLDRKPFYTRNPVSSAVSYEVESEKIRLAHTGYGDNFGTFTLSFPEARSKRVILEYVMGSVGLRPGEYDNTTIFYVKNKNSGVWHELVRAITPFGGIFDSSWEKRFYIDITEYQSLLQGETEFRYCYDGWDATETMAHAVTLSFIHYEGEPERELIAVENIYDSSTSDNTGNRAWAYGLADYDIEAEERLGKRTITIPQGTTDIELRFSITGHGHDQGTFPDVEGYQTINAAEFDENYYTIYIDGIKQSHEGHIFYSNADNYLQYGTYSYDRANWAPGNPANTHFWSIKQDKDAQELTIDIDLRRFESQFTKPSDSNGVARYVVHGDLFFYNHSK